VNAPVAPPQAASAKSPDYIRRAIADANLNALRVALFQATGDQAFAAMTVEQAPLNRGSSSTTVLAPRDREALIELAIQYLGKPLPASPKPGPSEVRRLVEMFAGRLVTDDEFALSAEQLAFTSAIETFGTEHAALRASVPKDFHVLVIGAGFGGIVSAIYLAQLGVPFTIVDRQNGIGGTWLANQYPDVRVDITSRWYQYTFEQDYPWRHFFAPGAEVRNYIEHVATKYGVAGKVKTGTEVKSAIWNEGRKFWDVECVKDGAAMSMRANVIVSAAGLFNRPLFPNLAGLDTFKGAQFHTTAWPADLDITGKRIVVIGTGSTGSQLVPKIAQTAGSVVVFQRSANWVQPAVGYHDTVPEEVQWLLDAVPYYRNWLNFSFHWHSALDKRGLLQVDQEWREQGGAISRRNDKLREHLLAYIRESLQGDEDLIAKCTPNHAPWTRRMVKDNGWYAALLRPNVTLVACDVAHIESDAVVAADGSRHPADIIVLSTGFKTEDYLWPVDYVGRGGEKISDAWKKDGARAHLGLTMPGFPNLFMLYGPNAQPPSGAMTKWLEVWGRYAAQAVATMVRDGVKSVEVSRSAFKAYNDEIDAAAQSLIWESAGKSSYYVNSFGRTSVNMPLPMEVYYKRIATFDPSEYVQSG
jgi:4-hydroxyacetophenone monooxygenase